jgi:hypothetical protein
VQSCASEKPNFSPVDTFFGGGNAAVKENKAAKSATFNVKANVNAAELSNLISTFPKLKNTAVNSEIINLKGHLQNYLYALNDGSKKSKKNALKGYEDSYKRLQKLRKFLNKTDDEILIRYLTRIKTNITLIEDSLAN